MFYKGFIKYILIIVYLKFFVFILDLGIIIEMISEEFYVDFCCGLIWLCFFLLVGRWVVRWGDSLIVYGGYWERVIEGSFCVVICVLRWII